MDDRGTEKRRRAAEALIDELPGLPAYLGQQFSFTADEARGVVSGILTGLTADEFASVSADLRANAKLIEELLTAGGD